MGACHLCGTLGHLGQQRLNPVRLQCPHMSWMAGLLNSQHLSTNYSVGQYASGPGTTGPTLTENSPFLPQQWSRPSHTWKSTIMIHWMHDDKNLWRRRNVMIMLVDGSHPVDPLTIALLLKAEIIDCSMLWKRVCLDHIMHTSIIIAKLYTSSHT